MEFDYNKYVRENLSFSKYQWPPDVTLTQLHNRCSEPGIELHASASCPCCGRKVRLPFKSWFKRDIYDDFKEKGAAIYGYFALLVFYLIFMALIFFVNGIYQIVLTFKICKTPSFASNCTNIGQLPFISFNDLYYSADQSEKTGLITLQTLTFYILLIANNLSILFIAKIKKKQAAHQSVMKRYSLLLNNCEMHSREQIKQSLKEINDGFEPKIEQVIGLSQSASFTKLYKKRYQLYFKIKSKRILGEDPFAFAKLIDQFKKTQACFLQAKLLNQAPPKRAILVFNTQAQAILVKKKLKTNFFKKNWQLFKLILKSKFPKLNIQDFKVDIFAQSVPQPKQIKWQYIGERGDIRLIAKLKTTFISLILMGVIYASLFLSLINSYNQKGSASQMTLLQKLLSVVVSIGTITISIYYRILMGRLAKDRCPSTQLEQSIFVLTTTVMFHILIYLIIPTIFYVVPDGIPQSTKLYEISQQARVFVYIQIMFSVLDWTYQLWESKKNKTLVNSKLINQLCQVSAHEAVDSPQYPLQLKMMSMFKIWSLSLFYAFFQPYVMGTMVVGVIVIYVLQKRNLYKHYNIKSYKSVQIQYKFLNLYIYFFCIYLCFIYSLNVPNLWQLVLALISTLLSFIAQALYQDLSKTPLKQLPSLSSLKISQNYNQLYRAFKSNYEDQQLDREIQEFAREVKAREEQPAKKDRRSSQYLQLIDQQQND